MLDRPTSGSSTWMAFLLGAAIVVAAMVVYFAYAQQSLDSMRMAEVRLIPPAPIGQPGIPSIPIPDIEPLAPKG